MAKMTTIKLTQKTKQQLDKLKRKGESYNAALLRMLRKDDREKELEHAYKDQQKYDKGLLNEWNGLGGDW